MANSDTEPTPSPSTSSTSEMNGASGTITVTEEHQRDAAPEPTVRLVLKKPKNSKKVNWTTETVDNEGMNKRKSKCCCIYKKPHVFGESSSESDEDECENCFGHCELKKRDGDPPPPPSVPPVS